MRCLISGILLLALASFAIADEPKAKAPAKTPATADRWEASIARFEARDKESPPPQEGIVFVGSSSIVGWDTAKSFPDLPVINRGFGGSQMADAVKYAPRIVVPYHPRIVVLYEGDNDIKAKKSPEQVAADFDKFVRIVHQALPKTRIITIGCKPSPSRWSLIDEQRALNRLLRARCEKDELLTYFDVEPLMLAADGQPKSGIFKPDNLHMNEAGYKLWNAALKPLLK
jgi:lysophospholipase L1-like esterase